jgi:predicted alpha-1,2-mannosidase
MSISNKNSRQNNENQLASLVNSSIGTQGSGNCLIGPYRPMGMVRLGPDSFYPNQTNGYQPGQSISGFSHTHVSGTGGSSRYGNVRIMPFSGEPRINPITPFYSLPIHDRQATLPKNEISKIGYYSAEFDIFSTKVELTCTAHVGLHNYTFKNKNSRQILIDAGSVIQTRGAPQGEVSPVEDFDSIGTSIGGFLQNENEYEFSGRSDFTGGWGHHQPYSIYFWIKSRQPFKNIRLAHKYGMVPGGIMSFVQGAGCRAVLEYDSNCDFVELDVGISFVSVANARDSISKEVGIKSFNEIRKECEAEWNQWLSRLEVKGGSSNDQEIFYSLIYRLMCMPTDLGVDAENPYWKSGTRHFTDFYCLWDSVRNSNSLYHLFAPELSTAFLNALLDIAEHTGWFPDAHIAGRHAYMQSGCACDILYSEAAIKGVQGVDYKKALHYLKKNCEEISPDQQSMGRRIDNYHKLGYVSTAMPKSSVSRHIEYTYYDKCMSKLAKKLGDENTSKRFDEYSHRVWNLWRDDKKSFWPKNTDGTWVNDNHVDVNNSLPDCWNDPYCYEGTIAIWSMNVMHDFPGLIKRMGGNDAFVKHLDKMFTNGQTVVQETRMHVPHLYTFAGRPDKAAETVFNCLRNHFSNTVNGLKDNEDMGCQSSFFIFNTMGIYPIYGQTLYMLTPPFFNEIKMAYGNSGKSLTITSNRESPDLCYIESVSLNNTPLDRAWIKHEEIANGGTLSFKLSKTPTKWGQSNLPTSY